ncbi:hypothetical protein F8568_032625 [Actinomadura sp. LD22]|uniref:Uncharacterized protein n=1 Tax=Actinomadura physcomitrii TaxID=2650748 RepID=A0A6I4MRV2_9ACTN|nr:hypothetical protein [Actinomadura physcomitrii]MWA05026.1 hypothetical protein [Actinomadura physcomitrii]
MPESRDLPPAGYTRAAPRPPLRSRLLGARLVTARAPLARRHRVRSSIPAVALALVLAAGIVGVIGYGTRREPPARSLTPDAASPTAPAPAASGRSGGAAADAPSPPPLSGPPGALPAVPAPTPGPAGAADDPQGARPGAGPSASQGAPGDRPSPVPVRPAATRPPHSASPRPRPAPQPHVPSKPRTARPAAPSWIGPECRRRFPADPARQAACVAALTSYYAK